MKGLNVLRLNSFEVTTEHSDDWFASANCRGDTKLFFPPKAERPQARARREAKANRLCTDCIVHSACQQFARDNHEYGFWASESEEERHLAGYTVSAPIGVRTRIAREAS
ncbi:MAG: WhiB family redox-sensing transcriptional regulator [Ilumatobacter sp.]|jgi:WhiB family redox-sensing transcriptional regulator